MIRDLTKGSIFKNLINVSLPIIGGSIFQMAYQLVDMIWLGKLGSSSVAAVGSASFYINLSYALATLAFIGGGIKVSHAIGKGNKREAFSYSFTAIIASLILTLIIAGFLIFFSSNLLDFFKLSRDIFLEAKSYLVIVIAFSIFKNLNLTYNRLFVGFGSSRIPFIIGSTSLILNIVLDPLFIFTFDMGVKGAAWATVISQLISSTIYSIIFYSFYKKEITTRIKIHLTSLKEIFKLSYPVTIQRVAFTTVSIILGKIISNFGSDAIAIQKIGVQLEALSWITAGGMQGAITSFIGQNYSAGNFYRVKRGYFTAISIIMIIGVFVTLLFTLLPRELFLFFVKEEGVIQGGVFYLRILSLSQIFMCIDITTMGAFNGLGKTHIPPKVSITFTALRIPGAILLSSIFGISGVWWAITLTTILKGTTLGTLFIRNIGRLKVE